MSVSSKDSKNKSFVLRIDTELMGAIEKWAADEFRSANGQILWILENALKKHRGWKNEKSYSSNK